MTDQEYKYADPDTLQGLLQRGRGEGYRQALLDPDRAMDLVVDCIARDPRCDHQVEARGWFYASLVAELGIDLARLRVTFDQPPEPTGDDVAWIATKVLELSAKRGIPGAVEELRRYLRSGRDPQQALHHLLPFAGQVEEGSLLREILEHADGRQIAEALWAVNDFDAAPWPGWRQASALIDSAVSSELEWRAKRDSGSGASSSRKRNDSLRGRLVQEAGKASPGTPLARLAALAGDQDDVLLEVAATLLDDPTHQGIVQTAIRHTLWSLTSQSALNWARLTASGSTQSGYAALNLLAKLAEAADVPRLRELLEGAIAEGQDGIYAQCALVEALGRLQDSTCIPAFKSLFETTVYSFLRRRCVVALSRTDPDFPSGTAVECLWDCESEARLLAINTSGATSGALRTRLAQIAGDVTEDQQCRVAAAEALRVTTC